MGLYQFHPPGTADKVIEDNYGSFTLGPDATSPLGLASAYSTLAAGGTQCDVTPVTAVLDPHGAPLEDADGEPLLKNDQCTPEAIPPGVANTLNQMLRKDVEPGNPGQTAPAAYVRGHQIAGKTGTAQGNVSVAFVGYTPEITASVMVFNPKQNEDVGGFGGGKGARVWHDAMAPILEARGSREFPPADPAVVVGNTKPVPRCDTLSQCWSVLASAGFQSVTLRVDSDKKEGELVGTSPPRGGRAVPGQLVSILVSNGSDYTEPAPAPAPPAPSTAPRPPPTPPVLPPVSPGIPGLPGLPGGQGLPPGGTWPQDVPDWVPPTGG
jgi:membrane peptidoglycan carboxypeptidase